MSGCKYFTSHNHGVTKKKCVHSSLSTGNYFDSNSSAAVPNEVSRPFQYCAMLPSSGRTADSIADKQVDIWSHFFLTEQIFAKKRLIWEEKHAHFIYVYIYLLKKKSFILQQRHWNGSLHMNTAWHRNKNIYHTKQICALYVGMHLIECNCFVSYTQYIVWYVEAIQLCQ